jgi:hypothetical protein
MQDSSVYNSKVKKPATSVDNGNEAVDSHVKSREHPADLSALEEDTQAISLRCAQAKETAT